MIVAICVCTCWVVSSPCSSPRQIDTRGLGVLLIDYLTTVEWTSFELLGEALKLHPTLLSKALRYLEAVSGGPAIYLYFIIRHV